MSLLGSEVAILGLSGRQIGLLLVILCLNLISFARFGSDKQRARRNRHRIPEAQLLRSAWLLGGIGAWLGMQLFHHKTRHPRFSRGVPVAALLTLAAVGLVIARG